MPRIVNLFLTVLVLAVLFGLSFTKNVAQDSTEQPAAEAQAAAPAVTETPSEPEMPPDAETQADETPDLPESAQASPSEEPQTGSEKMLGDEEQSAGDSEPASESPLEETPAATSGPARTPPEYTNTDPEGNDTPESLFTDIPGATGPTTSFETESPTSTSASTQGSTLAAEAERVPFHQTSTFTWLIFGLLLIGSYYAGQKLAMAWRLPDHGFRIFVLIFVTLGGFISAYLGRHSLTLGIDLRGGVVLVYDVEDPTAKIDMNQMARAIGKRINPAGVREIAISERGSTQLQIIIPEAEAAEVARIRRIISESGALEFRILASTRYLQDDEIIKQALTLGPNERVIRNPSDPEAIIAEWVPVDPKEGRSIVGYRDEEGDHPGYPDVIKRPSGDETYEVLVLFNDNCDVTGQYLSWVGRGIDETGSPGVSFHFDANGSERFAKLTSDNLPDSSQPEQVRRCLAILMNGMVHSAPTIKSAIRSSGIISFGKRQGSDGIRQLNRDIDELIAVLDAGSLPTALKKEPASELQIGATLGDDTIRKANYALMLSMMIVISFMLLYYRTAGLIACFCVITNLALIVATMLAVRAAFTLPGLAGLVLTIGMAIDANILIYERLREELAGGASLKMAIRNAYAKAFSAIFDSNVTSIIVGIVLYAVGTEQVKGFAVTLILGLTFNLLTAVYCARTIMDCMEAQRSIRTFRMFQLFPRPNINFIGARWYCVIFSIILTVVGFIAVGARGRGILDIDFVGGVSVEVVFKDSQQIENIREKLSDLNDRSVQSVRSSDFDRERGIKENTRFIITTSTPPGGDAEAYKKEVCDFIENAFEDTIDYHRFDYTFDESSDPTTETVVRLKVHPALKQESLAAIIHTESEKADDTRGLDKKCKLTGTDSFQTGPQFHVEWTMNVQAPRDVVEKLLQTIKEETDKIPYFANPTTIGGSVARDTQIAGGMAIFASLFFIVLYMWLRFQKLVYGIAAAIGLVHIVLIALGMIAISKWLAAPLGFLQIEEFKIGLPVVAAFLTIIAYALNDTIILFDRIRENRGKSPRLTDKMINDAINQTLSRTVLTTGSTAVVTLILYFWGGQGIHTFAFTMSVGIIFGTYGTIGICAPLLLWMAGEVAEKKDERDAF